MFVMISMLQFQSEWVFVVSSAAHSHPHSERQGGQEETRDRQQGQGPSQVHVQSGQTYFSFHI